MNASPWLCFFFLLCERSFATVPNGTSNSMPTLHKMDRLRCTLNVVFAARGGRNTDCEWDSDSEVATSCILELEDQELEAAYFSSTKNASKSNHCERLSILNAGRIWTPSSIPGSPLYDNDTDIWPSRSHQDDLQDYQRMLQVERLQRRIQYLSSELEEAKEKQAVVMSTIQNPQYFIH
ncbi:hypothetical protein BDN70DRAFT_916411 [Pholiota conissans]|uniref:Secreted protein n=1 Tax=Pholiota conissans TaxID=109636 RepID=A0A9P6D809_9AGAR|nr:hypothetical protein BDN70DRAFT_916411 [Pholiota conissans]